MYVAVERAVRRAPRLGTNCSPYRRDNPPVAPVSGMHPGLVSHCLTRPVGTYSTASARRTSWLCECIFFYSIRTRKYYCSRIYDSDITTSEKNNSARHITLPQHIIFSECRIQIQEHLFNPNWDKMEDTIPKWERSMNVLRAPRSVFTNLLLEISLLVNYCCNEWDKVLLWHALDVEY